MANIFVQQEAFARSVARAAVPEPTEIPEWAKQRACDLVNDDMPGRSWAPKHIDNLNHPMYALALHVLKHETPPVDPLLLEARERVAKHFDAVGRNKELAASVRAGLEDSGLVIIAIDSLRRGIEIGGGK